MSTTTKMDFRFKPIKAMASTSHGHCVICGRAMVFPAEYGVEMVDGGARIALPGTGDPNDPGFMGFQPIGNSCAAQVAKELGDFLIRPQQGHE